MVADPDRPHQDMCNWRGLFEAAGVIVTLLGGLPQSSGGVVVAQVGAVLWEAGASCDSPLRFGVVTLALLS